MKFITSFVYRNELYNVIHIEQVDEYLILAFSRCFGHECLIIDDVSSLQKYTTDPFSYFPLKTVIRFCLNECKSIVIFCNSSASTASLAQHMVILFLF